MDSRKMQVIGLCRFSYPAIGGFQVEHETIEDRIRYLYAEQRLEERFRLFESIALPCLRNQTDPDFDLIILIGDSLPDVYRNRLHDLTADIPQIWIVEREPGPHRDTMKSVINSIRRQPSEPCLQFRFDDDDAVSVDFISRFRSTIRQCQPLLKDQKHAAVDFCRGYIAETGPNGLAATEVVAPFTTPALGMYVREGVHLTIMNFAHHKIGQFMPTISIPDEPMWVRIYSAFNDSRQKKVKQIPVAPLTPEQETEFTRRFGIRADTVRQLFARA